MLCLSDVFALWAVLWAPLLGMSVELYLKKYEIDLNHMDLSFLISS